MKQIFNIIFFVDFFKNIKFLFRWYKSNFISPAPNFVKHKIIKSFAIKDSIFIETGTNRGETLRKLHKNFSYIYSIEPSEYYHNLSKRNLSDIKKKIKLVNGTSEDSLGDILEKCKNKSVTFFLDGHYSIGYQGLVEEKLGITVDKGETRSNWIRRPLTDAQLNYAASDVEFLIELFIEQRKSLIDGNKLEWLEEEVKFLSKRIFNPLECIEEIPNDLTKAEEKALLNKFNDIVLYTAQAQNINPTLFFSKKSQKDFLRFALDGGLESALKNTTNWRSKLIKEPLGNLLKGY